LKLQDQSNNKKNPSQPPLPTITPQKKNYYNCIVGWITEFEQIDIQFLLY